MRLGVKQRYVVQSGRIIATNNSSAVGTFMDPNGWVLELSVFDNLINDTANLTPVGLRIRSFYDLVTNQEYCGYNDVYVTMNVW